MKNLSIDHIGGLSLTSTAGVLLAADTHSTTPQTHDSVIVTTLVVKEHRESLLIKLPEATSKPAEQGNTILPAITRVFPFPYHSSNKVLPAKHKDSYQMSAS
jgi:hypothetical protein